MSYTIKSQRTIAEEKEYDSLDEAVLEALAIVDSYPDANVYVASERVFVTFTSPKTAAVA